ncbi:MAG: hypothetical protein FJ293_01755 [Planctomycetes bacterium]|nr:hypothetical protein [Planctomycetota bacterium]
MDLADLWQQHKKFILIVAGAFLLLLIGRGVLSSQYDYEARAATAYKTSTTMAKQPKVTDDVVRALQDDVASLKARCAELAKTMRHRPDEAFVVPPGEPNPRAFFFRRHRETQKALTEAAERQDIRVPEQLGLKDMAPTEPDEIRRQLVALDVVQQVVVEAIGAGVRRIASIQIEDAAKGRGRAGGFMSDLGVRFDIVGGEKAIRALVTGVVDGAARGQGAYLAVDQARIKPVKGEIGMLQLDLSVSALEIEAGSDEETP